MDELTNKIGLIGEDYCEKVLFPNWDLDYLNVSKDECGMNCSFFQNTDIDFIVGKKGTMEEIMKYFNVVNSEKKLFKDKPKDLSLIEVKTQTQRTHINVKELRYDIIKGGGIPGGMAKSRADRVIIVYIDNSNEITSVYSIKMLNLRKFMTDEKNNKFFIYKTSHGCLNIYIPMNILIKHKIATSLK